MTSSEIHKRDGLTTSPPHGRGYAPLSQQEASGFGYFGQLSLLKSQANPLGLNLIMSYSRIVFFLVTSGPLIS